MGKTRNGGLGLPEDQSAKLVISDFNFDFDNYDNDVKIWCVRCQWTHYISGNTLMELVGIANDHAELAHG